MCVLSAETSKKKKGKETRAKISLEIHRQETLPRHEIDFGSVTPELITFHITNYHIVHSNSVLITCQSKSINYAALNQK